ncbi:EAL domain-containing protein [Methylobacillus arboreus]|uniref:bifunctional diguanylate cyclase/phosphodiesterase n=1 Tax=Methylobacillus arboreus TaxID=755170 RepID=UPI001E2DC56D|nr:EAL domain-containing protein [Methylobacillus arboreus]MCB5190685.1 EAL domain-containing protein [Methylobacillus arboreus]
MAAAKGRVLLRFIILILGYCAIGMLGKVLPFSILEANLVWLPAGVAVAALLRWGIHYWPAVLVAEVVLAVMAYGPAPANWILLFILPVANTVAYLITAWMLRLSAFHHMLDRIRDIPMMVCGVVLGMLASAVASLAVLHYAQVVESDDLLPSLLFAWVANVIGVLLLLPLLLNISWSDLRSFWQRRRKYTLLAVLVVAMEWGIFHFVHDYADQYMLLAFLVLPFVVLISMRMGVAGTSLVVLVLSMVAMAAIQVETHTRLEGLEHQPVWALWVLMSTLSIVGLLITALQSSRELTEKALRNSETRFRAVIENAQDGIVSIDEQGRLVEFNQAAENMFGYRRDEVLGKMLVETLIPPALREAHKQGHQRYLHTGQSKMLDRRLELSALRADGTEFPVELTITSLKEQGVPLLTGFFRDLTERRKVETEIRNLAFYDALTSLPNRRLLMDRLQQAIVASVRHGNHGAVLFIDLDDFKALNDSRGHDTGDLLLIEVARRLRQCVRNEDTVARLGGDEFVIVLEDLSLSLEQAIAQTRQVAQKVLDAINHPYQLGEIEHHNSSSIGIVLFNGNFVSMEELLKRSDTAMYEAKAGGRNTLRFFDPAMQAALEKRVDMELQLRLAIVQEQLRLFCQVQVDAERKAFGAEVLLRWQHPEHGLLSPKEFVGIAEDSGLIVSIGHWVLYNACLQLKAWEGKPGFGELQLAVNVSARQFRHSDFVDEVSNILQSTGADPSLLKLELTESVVLDNLADAVAKMNALRELGVRFSMDDFGTGYSSLAYLKRLPLTQVKIDRSFVYDIAEDASDAAIVQAILAMSNTLGLNVIAEGVETEAQFDLLQSYGCRFFQGYLFSKPVLVQDFEQLLQDKGFFL